MKEDEQRKKLGCQQGSNPEPLTVERPPAPKVLNVETQLVRLGVPQGTEKSN